MRRPIFCSLNLAVPSTTWPGEHSTEREGGQCVHSHQALPPNPSSWLNQEEKVTVWLTAMSATSTNPRWLHVLSLSLPLTGFYVVLASSSVEPKLPCFPSLLPLPPPQPPGRYLGLQGGRCTRPQRWRWKKPPSSTCMAVPELFLISDFLGDSGRET